MTQTWHDVLFAHWPIDAARLTEGITQPFELDLFDGAAWLGIVPFRMTNVAPRGVPSMPWVSAFAELNVRTYVRVGDRPGVYFFSLDAGSALAVKAARALGRAIPAPLCETAGHGRLDAVLGPVMGTASAREDSERGRLGRIAVRLLTDRQAGGTVAVQVGAEPPRRVSWLKTRRQQLHAVTPPRTP